ncbi:unnamed protein product [Cunninghamella blakesleeana]
MSSDTFHGWVTSGRGEPLEWKEMPLKQWEDEDIEMNISHCGICGSDIHTMDSGWGPTKYPCVVGHEITGVVTKVGKNVTKFKVGDRVGVGAQSGSCLECDLCKEGRENLCSKMIGTYNSAWKNGDKTFGGYADKWRGHQHFVFKIPEKMTNETAATFLCAGVTTYSPLKRYNVQPGDRVGVIGIGGLGHFAVMWAKAMGAAEVVALSHSDKKKSDAEALGATKYVNTSNKEEMEALSGTLTHIICCSYHTPFDWSSYLNLLAVEGAFILVALPEEALSGISPFALVRKQIKLTASIIGSPKDIEEMLEFAQEHNVQPWLNKYKMTDAPKAIEDFRSGKPRYRNILEI